MDDCEEALAELYTYLDGELTDEKRQLIAAHLDGCNPCLEAFDFEAELRHGHPTAADDEVPESLRDPHRREATSIAEQRRGRRRR